MKRWGQSADTVIRFGLRLNEMTASCSVDTPRDASGLQSRGCTLGFGVHASSVVVAWSGGIVREGSIAWQVCAS